MDLLLATEVFLGLMIGLLGLSLGLSNLFFSLVELGSQAVVGVHQVLIGLGQALNLSLKVGRVLLQLVELLGEGSDLSVECVDLILVDLPSDVGGCVDDCCNWLVDGLSRESSHFLGRLGSHIRLKLDSNGLCIGSRNVVCILDSRFTATNRWVEIFLESSALSGHFECHIFDSLGSKTDSTVHFVCHEVAGSL